MKRLSFLAYEEKIHYASVWGMGLAFQAVRFTGGGFIGFMK